MEDHKTTVGFICFIITDTHRYHYARWKKSLWQKQTKEKSQRNAILRESKRNNNNKKKSSIHNNFFFSNPPQQNTTTASDNTQQNDAKALWNSSRNTSALYRHRHTHTHAPAYTHTLRVFKLETNASRCRRSLRFYAKPIHSSANKYQLLGL